MAGTKKETTEVVEQTTNAQATTDPIDPIESIESVFEKEMNMCRELISVEPTSRWPRLQLVHMIDCYDTNSSNESMQKERILLLKNLLQVDPTHAKFYEYQLSIKK